MHHHQGFADHIQLRVVESRPGHSVCTVTIAAHHLNPHGVVHGAVLFALADAVAGDRVGDRFAGRRPRGVKRDRLIHGVVTRGGMRLRRRPHGPRHGRARTDRDVDQRRGRRPGFNAAAEARGSRAPATAVLAQRR
jgi:hypothetical protein